VADVQGRPLAGASIEVSMTNRRYESVAIGRGVTDGDGRFALALSTDGYGDLGLGVQAPGFVRFGWAGYPQGITDEAVVLRRPIDRAYLEALRSVREPGERAARVLELAASDDLPEIEELFPYLGELRAELAAIASAPVLEPEVRRDGATPAEHASRLLAYWADPADDRLLARWTKEARGFTSLPDDFAAPMIGELCALWRVEHFRREKVGEPQTYSACGVPLLDGTGTHALALFRVRYAHWGYDMHLVMRREGERWVLRAVAANRIDHFRS
jgi:hypothetical protein